jgi:tripartite-type tricarboxylate transporter receptor subunit TctC
VRKLERCVVAVLLLVSASAALPQGPAWPVKPIHIVVSLTPGSATDILARAVSERLSAQLGQPVIVENRPAFRSSALSPWEELRTNAALVKLAGIKPN